MNNYYNQIIAQLLADKLITNSDIQRAFLKEEIGDSEYNRITEDNLIKYIFTRKMTDNFVDKIANWVKKVLDYEDKIKILTNKNNELQIDLSNQINRYKKDVLTLANKIDKNKQNSAKQIEHQKKEIQKLEKENAELKTIISKEQQERKNMAYECREILKKTNYKPRFHNQGNQNNLPMKNLSKKTKNKNSKINNNDNYIYIEENPYRN